MKPVQVVVTPGDGIGPEVVAAGAQVLQDVASLYDLQVTQIERPLGGGSIDRFGEPCTDEVLQDAQDADAVLLGAVGGPQWDDPHARFTPEEGVLRLREGLGLYANVRPIRVHDALLGRSPLRPEIVRGTDLVIVRELTGGLYFGRPKEMRTVDGEPAAVDTLLYRRSEVERIVRHGFAWASDRRGRLLSVDKFNVLVTGRFWRDIATEISGEYPDVEFSTMLADAFAAALVQRPTDWDVVVTENTFGDFLSDEAGMFTGSLGMLPSASLGDGPHALYEPVHGSAPDIAGDHVANPLATILSVALMFRHSFGLSQAATAIESAVELTLNDGFRTRDIGEEGARLVDTQSMTAAVIARIEGPSIN